MSIDVVVTVFVESLVFPVVATFVVVCVVIVVAVDRVVYQVVDRTTQYVVVVESCRTMAARVMALSGYVVWRSIVCMTIKVIVPVVESLDVVNAVAVERTQARVERVVVPTYILVVVPRMKILVSTSVVVAVVVVVTIRSDE